MKFKVGTKEFEIADDKITEAITNKTSVMTLVEEIVVRTPEEEATFVENRKKEARKEGVEIAVKKYREENGLTFEGKNIESLVKASTEKAIEEAKLNPDEAVKKVKETLSQKESALQTALKKSEELEKSLKETKAQYKIDKEIESAIPANTLLPADDIKTILKSKLEVRESEEGALEVIAGGKTLTNPTTGDALSVKEAIENFFRDNTHYVKAVEGGNGGGDSKVGANGKMSIEKFNETMKEANITINSTDYEAKLAQAIKEDKVDLEA